MPQREFTGAVNAGKRYAVDLLSEAPCVPADSGIGAIRALESRGNDVQLIRDSISRKSILAEVVEMPNRISWSSTLASDGGTRVSGRGELDIDAATSVTAEMEAAMGAAEALDLQCLTSAPVRQIGWIEQERISGSS